MGTNTFEETLESRLKLHSYWLQALAKCFYFNDSPKKQETGNRLTYRRIGTYVHFILR